MTMTEAARDGLQRLTTRVPLAARQRALPRSWRELHRSILHSYATTGTPPPEQKLLHWPDIDDPEAALARLADDDLIVRADSRQVTGAYPFSSETTAHRVRCNGIEVRAMCAVDALAIAPMFTCSTTVVSRCARSGRAVEVAQAPDGTLTRTTEGLQVGIRWQESSGHTAHSLCREMVFLAGDAEAELWMRGEGSGRTLYTLDEALAIAMAFFLPLTGR